MKSKAKKSTQKKIAGIFLMAAVSKAYGVGDTVWVWYHDSLTLEAVPQSRVVANVITQTSGNSAVVTFTNGNPVTDGATPRVFTTQALCATAIVSAAILRYTPAVLLDATTSAASTSGQQSTTLCRKS